MSRGPQVVFLGPSLAHDEAREILPDAILLPPAQMGDVLGALNRYRPHAIGLVDGTFRSTMSVFHKELLYSVDQGVWTLGASSMGALRASETHRFGVIGIGSVFEAYASGMFEDDDEVALTHADASAGYRSLSDAMVTIRATLEAAHGAGLITREECDRLTAMQKARYFPDRRLSAVHDDALSVGIDAERAALLRVAMRESVVDPKRADALALLHAMSDLPDHPVPVQSRPQVFMSSTFQAALARDSVVETDEGLPITFDRIRRFAAIAEDDYADVMREARRTHVLRVMSMTMGGPVSEDELDTAREALAERLGVPIEEVESTLASMDLDDLGVLTAVRTEAHVLRMERSWMGRTAMGMVTEPFLHELRLRGRYHEVKESAALQSRLAQGVLFDPLPSAEAVISTHMALTGWKAPENWLDYLESEELGSMGELLETLTLSVRAHHSMFGTGLVRSGEDAIPVVVAEDAPMSRGR